MKFPIEKIFRTPSMIISPEDMTLYNINEALEFIVSAEQIRLESIGILIDKLDEISAKLDKAAKSAAKSPPAAKKGGNT